MKKYVSLAENDKISLDILPAHTHTSQEVQIAYSTEEQAIGTWINGKSVYQKTLVYEVNPLPSSGWAYYKFSENEIAEMSVDQFVDMRGTCSCYSDKATETPLWQPIPRVCPDALSEYSIGAGDFGVSKVGILFGTAYTGATIYLTIEYTKVV